MLNHKTKTSPKGFSLFTDSSDDDVDLFGMPIDKAAVRKQLDLAAAKKAAPRPPKTTAAAVPKPVSESNEARREADRLLRRREVLGPNKTLLPGQLRWKTQEVSVSKQNEEEDDDQGSDMTSDQPLPFLDLLTSISTEAAAVAEDGTEETASGDKAITTSASSAAGNEAVSSVLRGHSRRGNADSILCSSHAAQSPPPKQKPASKKVLGARLTKK